METKMDAPERTWRDMDDLLNVLRGEGDAHFRGNVRDRRTIGALLCASADALAALTAERDALREALDAIETMTATGDGLSPDEMIAVHQIACAALGATKDQK